MHEVNMLHIQRLQILSFFFIHKNMIVLHLVFFFLCMVKITQISSLVEGVSHDTSFSQQELCFCHGLGKASFMT